MKILVVGGSGTVGSKIVNYFTNSRNHIEYTYLTHDIPNKIGYHLDIRKKEDVIKTIVKYNPDIVIHTSALTNVDLCETNRSLAESININGTENIIESCKIIKCMVVFTSTSAIFDGTKDQYYEGDTPSPSTHYGFTKYKGEELVINSGLPHLILRTDQPYCWTEKWQRLNSVLRALQTLRSGKILREVTDWYNTPTYVPDLVHAIEKLITNNQQGIFHLVGSEFINRYNWTLKVAKIFNLDKKLIEPITSDSLKLPVKRVNVNLNNGKLFRKTGIKMRYIEESLNHMHQTEIV